MTIGIDLDKRYNEVIEMTERINYLILFSSKLLQEISKKVYICTVKNLKKM